MRRIFIALILLTTLGCGAASNVVDPTSDQPDYLRVPTRVFKDAPSYEHALVVWQNAEDVNAWIGANFDYDLSRAMLLSETQRNKSERLPIYEPHDFFTAPSGVCIDLTRFAVETLRVITPQTQPKYLMIEFEPISMNGNTFRMHWMASFQKGGAYYFFADSKRPGEIIGPYATTREFINDYSSFRGRKIVSFRELESYERQQRTQSAKQSRDERH